MDQQEKLTLEERLNTQRWLINNGLVPDSIKNQLFFFGTILHTDVQAVEVKIRPETKTVDYVIYVKGDLLKKIDKYKKLSAATSLFGLWRFKRLLQKEGNLDFQAVINPFVRDFCGPGWVASVAVTDYDAYEEGIGVESEQGPYKQLDKLPH